ncbi:MAG: PhzF family phenazine biosynthesis protein [Adhaeribacter sp.]
MKKIPYYLADVFTDHVFGGNQLAVFPEGQLVPEHLMQRIARELNLSETTFVLPPVNAANDIRLRIFTPGRELPMAGHPTLGTAHVLLELGLLQPAGSHLVFEEGVGDIRVDFELRDGKPGLITMGQPLPAFGDTITDAALLAELLSLQPEDIDTRSPAQVVSCGVPYLLVPLVSLDAVKRARLQTGVLETKINHPQMESVFLFCRQAQTPGGTVHGRMFAPAFGITEDPATGSACGPLGCYLVHYGLVPAAAPTRILCEQGFEMGRPSLLHITIGQTQKQISSVQVAGQSVLVGEGFFYL